jgi:regulator of chromosome condensation
MHCAALTYDNKILTWGVNDLGALGRDTTWDGGLVDIKDGDSDSGSESDSGLNPREATPAEVDISEIPDGTVFTQLAASDNATFALTDKGLVYGWGTIRVSSPTPFCSRNLIYWSQGKRRRSWLLAKSTNSKASNAHACFEKGDEDCRRK